ncbi:transcriptional regulator, TetR family [Paenibacillus curdlanolyticus YK9]|uniref:Transcriptional regulator, TetR family n=1 Tax=Paenibacillus curdlanolyticus YK9 TaxID=717606 RepID=E0I7C5_9BACL|nr:TetR/AcrR family transcriptional regulator [Paenibacillus curdlanolyticus]EFM11941.1 transcriptional regulator, TetR family [Paenibacillus curdlanolyticus YK9]
MLERKTLDRKRLIVEAAEKSFTMFGYKATTMDLVSKLAGVGKGTIYTFFATKEELFGEIIRQLTAEMKAAVVTRIDSSRSFFENLTDALHGVLQFRETHELFIKLAQEFRELGTPTVQEGLSMMEEAVILFIEREIEQAQQKGELREMNPSLTAFLMIRMYLALAAEWSKRHEPLTKEEVAEQFTSLFRYGICAKQGEERDV